MTVQWIKTGHPGLRYYEHPTRKHGKQKDRYYSIYFKVDKKLYNYGVGWLSDGVPEVILKEEPGVGFQDYCLKMLRQYKNNVKIGTGPKSPKEKRDAEDARRAEEKAEAERLEQENITFGQYFEKTFFPTYEIGRKKTTTRKSMEHFKNWIEPVIGNTPLKTLKPSRKTVHSDKKNIVEMSPLDKIAKNLLDAGRSPRTLQYVMATVRQTWNMARRDGVVDGDTPTRNIRRPKVDNRRVRFLSHKEAETLLTALQKRDRLTHDLALLSLHTGLRFGEAANLRWGHIDPDRGIIRVMDTKRGEGRAAFMTEKVKAMFEAMERREPENYVFTRGGKEPLKDTPRDFSEVVASLSLNDGVSDRRQKVCFHTLRHTFASWHVTAGTDIYTVKELLGHSVIAMTERYSHLAPGTLRNATQTLEKAIGEAAKEEDAGQVVNFPK